MGLMLSGARKLVGLFIDDGSLAFATVAILGLVGAARSGGFISSSAAALLLCGGIFLALLENVLRSVGALERRARPEKRKQS